MNLRESESITPQDLINSRVVTTVINTFFWNFAIISVWRSD